MKVKEYNKNIVRTIPFFITGVVLAVLLTIQSSLLIGAVKAKGMVDAAEIYITQLTENVAAASINSPAIIAIRNQQSDV